MYTKAGKFLVIGTLLCISASPALAQGSSSAPYASIPATSPTATIGEIKPRAMEIYKTKMRSALAMTDSLRRDAAVTSARQELARDTGKPLTAVTISEVDGMLDIGGASPQLGATG